MSQLAGAGGRVYWIEGSAGSSPSLYSQDGDLAEPVLLVSGSASHLTPVGDAVFVVALNGVWTADAQGARLVKALTGGTADAYPRDLMSSGGLIYFVAESPVFGRELYRSDGTPEGTFLLKDIWPGRLDSSPQPIVDVNGTLYFGAFESLDNGGVWRTDGTPAGTVRVPGVRLGRDPVNVNGTYYFTGANNEPWTTDLTPTGTAR